MQYTYDDIVSYFKEKKLYKKEDFDFINERTKRLPINFASDSLFGIFPKIDKNGNLIDFIISLPRIENKETYLINLNYYKKALKLMNLINMSFKNSIYIFKDNMEEKINKSK